MTIVEMLEKEIKAIKDHPQYKNFIRNDAVDIMISVQFADRKVHHILPGLSALRVFVSELTSLYKSPTRRRISREKHESDIMPDFVDVKEMEI